MNNENILFLITVNLKIPLEKTQISRKMAQYLFVTGFAAREQQLSEFLLISFFCSQGCFSSNALQIESFLEKSLILTFLFQAP